MNRNMLILTVILVLFSSITVVSANERVTADTYDYFTYFGHDTPAGQTHQYAIEVDGQVYYIADNIADKLASYSYSFRIAYDYDLEKWSNKFKPDAISFGTNGFNAYYSLGGSSDSEMFQFSNDKAFDFEYVSGQQVGFNSNAKVITKIFYPSGGEIRETYI